LRLGVSTTDDLRRFAGRPSRRNLLSGGTTSDGTGYSVEALFYRFPANGSATYYFANSGPGWVLDGFETTLDRFRTAHGSRVGMPLAEAERREQIHRVVPACPWPSLQRASGNRLLDIGVYNARVVEIAMYGPYPPGC
jgi:hypothetical protein